MSDYFIGEIKLFGFNFAPKNWALCQGQLVSIASNNALFALLGTTYGGDGVTTFQLPDLRSRSPKHFGQGPGLANYALGQTGGVENVTLTTNQMPVHAHNAKANTSSDVTAPGAGRLLGAATDPLYSAPVAAASKAEGIAAMNSLTIVPTGGSQPHTNLPPYLALNFSIALFGIFPPRN